VPRTALPRTDAEPAAETAASRRSWRPVLWVLLGAVIAIVAVVVVDRAGSSDSEQAAPTTTAPTTTTVAPPVAQRVFKTIQPSLVLVETSGAEGNSLGSGVIVTRDGQIMTADHVVEGATEIEVTFADGTKSPATVASSEPDRDTAILQPEQPPSVIVPAVIGGGVQVGDDTYSVGNPLGLVDSMTAGVVSALNRTIEREDDGGSLEGLIQFDAAVNPGSSGGPLLNRQGQVVGIVTALANPSGERFFVGIGFAVPITGGGGGGRVPQS
jgi:putative serine protease PepD